MSKCVDKLYHMAGKGETNKWCQHSCSVIVSLPWPNSCALNPLLVATSKCTTADWKRCLYNNYPSIPTPNPPKKER